MDKKLRKKLIFARNHRIHIILQQIREQNLIDAVQRKENERVRRSLESSGEIAPGEEPVWSAKTQEIRDRLTGKKRHARERWNRFAGTSGGGGMGR